MLYESVEKRLPALRVYGCVSERFSREFCFDIDFWRFGVLSIPSLGERAATEAARSDLVMITIDGRRRLPLEFQDWLDTWIRKKMDQDRALVLLAEHADEGPACLQYTSSFLRGVAARGRMTFIAQPIEANGETPSPLAEQKPAHSHSSISLLEYISACSTILHGK